MDKNHPDETTIKLTAVADKPSPPPSSPENNEKLGRLQKVRKKASQPPIVFVSIAAFAGVIALIIALFVFNWTRWLLFLIIPGILSLFLLIQAGYNVQGTGFSDKKLWHWIKLLFQAIAAVAIPISIIVGLIQFNTQQEANARTTTQQAMANQALASDQQRATILQTYINNIQDLLLNHNLSKSKPGDEIRQVAKVQTFTTLRRLDAGRNSIVLRFLQDAHLIGTQDAVINLSGADLSDTQLSGADLSGADLYGADLSNADLSNADLSNAILNSATLSSAILNGATLSSADLGGAILSKAALTGATLTGATLSGATLTGADLSSANLYGADLSSADLSDTQLSGADLSKADLTYSSYLTQQQLDTVSSCTHAILSASITCHRNGSMVTLNYWYTEAPAETPVILQLIQQFQQQNPNIRINPVNISYFQALAQFTTAVQAGKTPDVFRSDVGWVTQFASKRYLLNIDSYVRQSDLSDYLSAPLSYDKYNGHLYGLPQVTDFLALLYNKAEFKKAHIASPPTTMAEFEADAMKVMRSKAARYGFETSGAAYYALPFLWAFGGGMIDHNNSILVNNPGSVKGLDFLLKLQNTDHVMPKKVDFSNGYYDMVNDFKNGKTAMIFDGPYEVSNILAGSGSAFRGNPSNLGITAVPRGPSGQIGSPMGGQSYVISASTAHPVEAYKFISFMSSRDSQAVIAAKNHTLPTRLSAYQDPRVSSSGFFLAFYSIQYTAVARPAIPQSAYLLYTFDSNIRAALDGAEKPLEALNAVAEAWKRLLAGS